MVFVSTYLPVYDIQGEEIDVEVPETKQAWEEMKQKLIGDFIDQYGYVGGGKVAKKKGILLKDLPFLEFGVGTYKDTRLNRALGRVGLVYDKNAKFNKIRTLLMNGVADARIRNEEEVLRIMKIISVIPPEVPVRRKWTSKEEELLLDLAKQGIANKAIAARLLRTYYSVKNKRYRLEKVNLGKST